MFIFSLRLIAFVVASMLFGWGAAHHRIHPALAVAIVLFIAIIAGGDLVP